MSTRIASKTVACQLLDWIENFGSFSVFDYKAKKRPVFRTCLLLLIGLLQKRASLAEITTYLKSARWLQKRLGFASLDDSSLNRRLSQLPTEWLQQLYTELVADLPEANPSLLTGLKKPQETLYLVDSSAIKLRFPNGKWGILSGGHCAAKLHTRLRFSPGGEVLPDALVCTSASVTDRDEEVLSHLVTPRDGTYVFDRGYVNYARFVDWNDSGIRFVARLYANQKLKTLSLRETSGEAKILEDAVVEVAGTDGQPRALRRVTYRYFGRKEHESTVVVLTNRWDVSASEVAELYRKRWRIETFFNDFKNRMNGAKMHTSNPRGVSNQLLLAAIGYVWMERLRREGAPNHSIGEFIRLFALFAGESRTAFLDALHPNKTRSSRGRVKKRPRGRRRKHPIKLEAQRWIQPFRLE